MSNSHAIHARAVDVENRAALLRMLAVERGAAITEAVVFPMTHKLKSAPHESNIHGLSQAG